jgi:hypothetical protein
MRFIFALIGILFDIVILALSAIVIYAVFDPKFVFDQVDMLKPYLDDSNIRMQVIAVALVCFVFSFRGVFLLMFGGKERLFVVRRDEHGALTVSRSTLEHIVSRIAADQSPAATIESLKIAQDGAALNIGLRLKLDITKCNLREYTDKFNSDLRNYFKDSMGIELSRLDVQAEAGAAESSAA